MSVKDDKYSAFRFKQFSVSHQLSGMKVGVDGVLLGAWAKTEGKRGLDIGCGCGLIALMCAQRNHSCCIDAIDIDSHAITEAWGNVNISKWNSRISVKLENALDYAKKEENVGKYDFIVSNPPYFNSGITSLTTKREFARHQLSLPFEDLLKSSFSLLKKDGALSVIYPVEIMKKIGHNYGLTLENICYVSDRAGRPSKRVMLQFRKGAIKNLNHRILYIRNSTGEYSEEYRLLTKEFYLNF